MDRQQRIQEKMNEVKKYEKFIEELLDELYEYVQLLRNAAHDLGFYLGLCDEEDEEDDESTSDEN